MSNSSSGTGVYTPLAQAFPQQYGGLDPLSAYGAQVAQGKNAHSSAAADKALNDQFNNLPDSVKYQIFSAFQASTGLQGAVDFNNQDFRNWLTADIVRAATPFAFDQPQLPTQERVGIGLGSDQNDDLRRGGAGGTFATIQPRGPNGPISGPTNQQVDEALKVSHGAASPFMQLVITAASQHGVPWQVLFGLLQQESSFNPTETGVDPSDHGIAQINAIAHPDISLSQANDPTFAIPWAAQELAQSYAKYHDWGLSLIAYHQGGSVADYMFKHGQPAQGTGVESAKYVSSVLKYAGTPNTTGFDPSDPAVSTTPSVLGTGQDKKIQLPDQVTLGQSIKTAFQNLFFRAPTPQELDGLVKVANQGVIDGQMSANDANNPYSQSGPLVGKGGSTNVINTAQSMIGTPYVWGGKDPSKGLDCSGFTQAVFKQIGIDIGGGTGGQWNNRAGTNIGTDLSQAMPGDLLFFNDPNGDAAHAHVGIYVGNGMMIDAPHSGASVRYDNVAAWVKSGEGLFGIKRFDGAAANTTARGPAVVARAGSSTGDGTDVVDQALRNSPRYKQLYGNKPSVYSDAQYAQVFEGADKKETAGGQVGGSIIPPGLMDTNAVTTGMELGRPDVTAAISSEEELNNNGPKEMGDLAQTYEKLRGML